MNTLSKIDQLSASIVAILGQVGLTQYNKLPYLFELLYIKNFGRRYTGEKFVRIDLGPVIPDYKNRIDTLKGKGILAHDGNLQEKRKVGRGAKKKIPVSSTSRTKEFMIDDPEALSLLNSMLKKYGKYNSQQLETVVYASYPMKAYLQGIKEGTKNEIQDEVIDDRVFEELLKSPKIKGREIAQQHLLQYPSSDDSRHQILQKEFEGYFVKP